MVWRILCIALAIIWLGITVALEGLHPDIRSPGQRSAACRPAAGVSTNYWDAITKGR
jgi:hypothetical protein